MSDINFIISTINNMEVDKMDFEKIKTLVTATSAFVTAGNIYTKLNINGKLSESEVSEFLEPMYKDLMNVKQGLEDITMDRVRTKFKETIDSLKAPKFLKDNRKVLVELENHIGEVINRYNSVCNLCVGVVNESLRIENLNCFLNIEELGDIPPKLVDYLFHFKNSEEVNDICKDLINLVQNKISINELDWIEERKLNQKINNAVLNAINGIKAIDISIENPINEFVRKYFDNTMTNTPLTEYQIMLQGHVRSFLEYRSLVFNKVRETATSIEEYYEKHKPKK